MTLTPEQLAKSREEFESICEIHPSSAEKDADGDYLNEHIFDLFKVWLARQESLAVPITQKYELARKAYIELTNNVGFADNGEAAYVADQRLMSKFDEAFE